MNSKELSKRLSDGKIDNLYLFYGEEDYIKDTYIEKIKSIVLENDIMGMNFTQFDDMPDKNELIEAVESAPVMCEKKIVFLNGLNIVSTSSKKEVKDTVCEIIEDIPEYTVIIIREKETDTKKISKPMLTLIKKYGVDILCDKLDLKDMMTFINRQFANNKKRIRKEDLEYLISICEPSINSLLREVEVISAYLNEEEEVTRNVIDLLVKKSIEDRVFSLSDAIINKDKKNAYEILSDLELLKNQHPPGKIFSIICDHFMNLYVVILNNNDRVSQDVTLSMLELNGRSFLINKYLRQKGKIEIKKLREIIKLLSDLDFKVKNGMTDPYYAIEQIIAIV
ncbi:MAG: DNA polymerase III subunit delta [Clostridia bacterium]|nr:DNA polymerase III subunit delta [Clostridia bacterium]